METLRVLTGWMFAIGVSTLLVFKLWSIRQLQETNRRLQKLLQENYESAKLFVQKDRELILINQELEERNRELDSVGKMLVRRDLELTQSNERLQELDAVKSQFVAVAAHQLRTPLTGIKWTLDTLLKGRVGAMRKDQQKITSDAYKTNNRLIELVNDLLDVARLEEGRFGFEFKTQQFVPLVEQTCIRLKPYAETKGVSFGIELPKTKLPSLMFDKEKIVVVLETLIDNAIKYTKPGGKVIVCVKKDGDHIIVEVEDSGIGIPEEQIPSVFNKFFRARNAQLYQTEGTGLGLYLAKNIVEHHNGKIWVQSKEMKGSIFSFTLPFLKEDDHGRLSLSTG